MAGLTDGSFKTGRFYASRKGFLTGPVVDQATLYDGLNDPSSQDNAWQAVRQFA